MTNTTITTTQTEQAARKPGIDSFRLHIIAFAFMLCDHLWATIIPGNMWMTYAGRIAYPIFAFCITEGLRHTSDRRKYILRLLACALLSEIPFNLIYEGTIFYPYHQNVLWTYLFAIAVITLFEKVKERNIYAGYIIGALAAILSYFAAYIIGVDFYGEGLLMVYTFYLFPGKTRLSRAAQFACMVYINWILFQGMYFEVSILGNVFEIQQQGFAVLALIPIWLYNGEKGYSSPAQKWAFYLFYPVHMLVLGVLAQLL